MSVLLAVSGGIDSMYLANRSSELFPGERFAVAHCNFGLRGSESDGDELFVQSWCSEHAVEFHSKRFDTESYALQEGISIEMAARNLRYAWFSELCKTGGHRAVAVAHNANDNAETLMLNLLRGTGSRGLRGMAAESIREDGLTILRPLLGTKREDMVKWMNAHGCQWREDSTNADSEFKRNKLRNLVFPIFKEINPSFVETLGADMKRFAMTDDIASEYFLSVMDSCMVPEGISVHSLLELKHWKFVLWRLLEGYGLAQPSFDKLVTLLEKYKNEPMGTVTLGGKVFEGHGYRIRIHKKTIIAERI